MSGRRGRGARTWSRERGRTAASSSSSQKQLEHIASVSRSSGLEKDGNTLKDFKVQQDYRTFIQDKVNDFLKIHPKKRHTESEEERNRRINAQENILILFRKLREGISSSGRTDLFALEVYETSLYLSAAFGSPQQLHSIIPHLVPHLYLSSPLQQSRDDNNRLVATLISLLHYLVDAYPSQISYRQHLSTIPSEFFSNTSSAPFHWIVSLAKSLRTQSYATFEALTEPSTIARLFVVDGGDDISEKFKGVTLSDNPRARRGDDTLRHQSLYALVHLLREKARVSTWGIIRSAYREVSCDVEGTRLWLKQTLCLHSVVPYGRDISADEWLQQQSVLGHVKQKEGVEGKWLIYRAR